MNDISTALWITALGMGLVFGAIIVLWIMMVLINRLSADKKEPEALSVSAPRLNDTKSGDKARVAAIAVAMALAEQQISTAKPLSIPPTALVSAWQLGMRTRQMSEKGNVRRR